MNIPRSKFNVDSDKSKRTFDGVVFDSEGEMKMYRDFLLPALNDGLLQSIERQKTYVLQEGFRYGGERVAPITYKADFVIKGKCGQTIVLDFKGMPDNVAKIKRKMFWQRYQEIPFYWIAYSKIDGGYRTYEYIQKRRKERRQAKKGAK